MANLQILLAMILIDICVQKKYPQVFAQIIYPGYSSVLQDNSYPMYHDQSHISPTTYLSAQPSLSSNLHLLRHPSNQFIGNPSNQFIGNPSNQFIGNPSSQLIGNPSNQLMGSFSNQLVSNPSNQLIGNPSSQFHVNPVSSQLLLANQALNLRKERLYRNILLNRHFRQKGVISREDYVRNMKQNEDAYRQLLKQQYHMQRHTRLFEWNKQPRGPYIFSTTTPIPIISSTKVPKYQNFKINFNGKTKLKSLSLYAPKDIIPVMRSVPNPDSINNAIVNLAQSEPLREKVMNAQLRRPANSLESGENLDTFHRKHKKSSLRSGIEKKVKSSEGGKSHKLSWSTGTEHNPWESSPSQEGGRWESSHSQRDNFHTWGFQPPQRESSEEVDRRTSGARVRHDEKKKYSTKITATGDHQSTEVVEGELFPIQLQGGPVYKRTGEVESFNQNGAVGTSVPEIRANMFLADQNGNMHKIRDNMVPHELVSTRNPIYQTSMNTRSPDNLPNSPTERETVEMSRIADSLVFKYKQYQALQKLINAEKPSGRTSTTTARALNGTSTTPNYSELLTFDLTEFINNNTSPPPPPPSPLETIRLSLLHKSPLNEHSPPTGETSTDIQGNEKIRELAQRIIAMKKSEMQATSTTTQETVISRETEWTPLVTSSDLINTRIRNHRMDYKGYLKTGADQYVEIYTKDKLTRLSTHAKKNDTNIVYAKAAKR